MDHGHLFSFALTEGYKCFGCIYTAGWDASLKTDIAQRAKMQEQIHSDPSWNNMDVNWDHVGWTMYHPLWRKRYSTWLQGEISNCGCYIEQRFGVGFFSVLMQMKFLPLTEAIQSAQNVKRKNCRSGSQARRHNISRKDLKTISQSWLKQTSPWPVDVNSRAPFSHV